MQDLEFNLKVVKQAQNQQTSSISHSIDAESKRNHTPTASELDLEKSMFNSRSQQKEESIWDASNAQPCFPQSLRDKINFDEFERELL